MQGNNSTFGTENFCFCWIVILVPGLCTYSCSSSWAGSRWQPLPRMDRSTQSTYHTCRISCRPMASHLLSTGSFLVTGERPLCSRYGMSTILSATLTNHLLTSWLNSPDSIQTPFTILSYSFSNILYSIWYSISQLIQLTDCHWI